MTSTVIPGGSAWISSSTATENFTPDPGLDREDRQPAIRLRDPQVVDAEILQCIGSDSDARGKLRLRCVPEGSDRRAFSPVTGVRQPKVGSGLSNSNYGLRPPAAPRAG
jgi:hypothetical protein